MSEATDARGLVEILEVKSLESGKLTRLLYHDEAGIDVPIQVHKKNNPSSDKLLVTYNGALSRSKAPDGIVFQRSSWLDEFTSDVVQIADPTLVKYPRLSIGWAQANSENWAIDSYKKALDWVRNEYSLQGAKSTVHYGSSAGGFQAIATACLDGSSKAIANNPQLDWSRYNPVFVKALMRDVFAGREAEDLRESQPERVSVVELFKLLNYVPDTTLVFNAGSAGDVDQQIIPAVRDLQELSLIHI